jgi:hypothetical protein
LHHHEPNLNLENVGVGYPTLDDAPPRSRWAFAGAASAPAKRERRDQGRATHAQPGAASAQRQAAPHTHAEVAAGTLAGAESWQPQEQPAPAQSRQGHEAVEGTFMAISW